LIGIRVTLQLWKTLKLLIRGQPNDNSNWEEIDFEGLDGTGECSLADGFNIFYVQNIDTIVRSINNIIHQGVQ